MSRRDRFRLKSQLVEELEGPGWSFSRTNLLLAEFGLETLDEWDNRSVGDLIANRSDTLLIELYSVVFDVDLAEVEGAVDSVADDGCWKRGYVRVFLSHSAAHKQFVSAVANELAVVGIHGFVAHEAMEVSRPWQTQIENALRSAQVSGP